MGLFFARAVCLIFSVSAMGSRLSQVSAIFLDGNFFKPVGYTESGVYWSFRVGKYKMFIGNRINSSNASNSATEQLGYNVQDAPRLLSSDSFRKLRFSRFTTYDVPLFPLISSFTNDIILLERILGPHMICGISHYLCTRAVHCNYDEICFGCRIH